MGEDSRLHGNTAPSSPRKHSSLTEAAIHLSDFKVSVKNMNSRSAEFYSNRLIWRGRRWGSNLTSPKPPWVWGEPLNPAAVWGTLYYHCGGSSSVRSDRPQKTQTHSKYTVCSKLKCSSFKLLHPSSYFSSVNWHLQICQKLLTITSSLMLK